MQRSTVLAKAGGIGLLLGLVCASAQAVSPSNPGIEQAEAAALRPATGPWAGIRTFGTGSVRLEVFEADAVEAVETETRQAATRGPGVGVVRKISGATMAGSVTAFGVGPDGLTAVYIADQDTAGRFELYSTPVDGSAPPTKISAGLPFGAGDVGVDSFQIGPGGTQVVFLADPNLGGGDNDIFSVPIDGSVLPPVQLNPGNAAPVTAFGIAPDGVFAAFFGVDSVFGSGGVELYNARVGVASSAAQISDVGNGNPLGGVVSADFSPDGATMIYAGDAATDQLFQWFSVPIAATGPGSDVLLSAALGSVSLGAVSPDSSTVVYIGDDNVFGVSEVFAVPIGGGSSTRLNPAMAGDGAISIEISSDGNRVGYLADQNTAGVTEVYSALIGVAGSGIRLNTPMAGTQFANTLNISPESTTVLFEADQDRPGTKELYAVPIDAGAAPSTLHGLTPPDNVGFFTGLGTPIIGRRAVYPVFGATVDVFSVPFDGSEPFTQLNDTLTAGETLFNAFLPLPGARLIAFGVGSSSGSVTDEVNAVPIRPDLPQEQINVTAGAGAMGVLSYVITADEQFGVYLQDQDTLGKPELYSRELDSDADTVINGVDNCPFVANLAQGPVVFGQTVFATSKTGFGWSDSTELRFVRGPLAMVDVLATDGSGTLIDAASYDDGTTPASGFGLYYLFAPDCAGRSYQTVPGAEPDRDLAAFP